MPGSGDSTPLDNTTSDVADNNTQSTEDNAFRLTSPAIVDGELLSAYQCEEKVNGEEDSIPLAWSNVPSAANKLAITMHEESTQNTYLLLWDIDASVQAIDHGKADEGNWFMGPNKDGNTISYTSPCSHDGGSHEYTLTLYALSETPASLPKEDSMSMTLSQLRQAIAEVTLDNATLIFTSTTASTEEADSGSTGDNLTSTNRCNVIQQSVTDAGFGGKVAVTCDQNYAYLASDTYPDHNLMNGIVGTNEQIPVPAKDYVSPIRLSPVELAEENFTTRDAALGVAVNGVPIYDYSSGGELELQNWTYRATEDTVALKQLDNCGGHAGRGDDYHYHKQPNCMLEAMPNKDQHPILGWAFDGYPIYGDEAPDGSQVGSLGLCNQIQDETFGVRYHTSTEPPYILMCLVGETEASELEKVRVPPFPERTAGVPIEATNLQFEVSGTTRRLSYTYQGQSYFISYTPSAESNCYDFVTETHVENGKRTEGTFCR